MQWRCVSVAMMLAMSIVSSAVKAGEIVHRPDRDAWLYTQTSETMKAMTPDLALTRLKEGNARFVSGKMKNRNLIKQAKLTQAKGQYPFAVILSCMDSRASPELIFDQGIGDVFSIRVAGNVVDEDQLGGLEYAAAAVGSHLIVVMGHTSCGAVSGACSGVEMGSLTQLLHKIAPAVTTVKESKKVANLNCKDVQVVNDIAKQNVLDMVEQVKARSKIIRDLIQDKQVKVVGAMQDLQTGQVTLLD